MLYWSMSGSFQATRLFFERLNPEQETKHFFEEAKDYFADRFGEQNIRYATVHLDETTPTCTWG